MRPRARTAVVASLAGIVAVLVALTGCGLPTSSPVLPGRRVDEVVVPDVRTMVPPPAPGAGPESIVRGFIRAGIEFQATESTQPVVGVEYLAPDSVQRWQPLSAVTVFDRSSALSVADLGGGRWRASVAAVASVDADGRYRELPAGTIATVDLELVQVSGEWRIRLPGTGFGIWVSTDDFSRLFEPFRVSYVASFAQRLISDVRWFPSGQRVATALARAQLSPIPDYLAGAVSTGVPEGTRLAVDAVAVQDRVATVTLSTTAQGADPAARRAMWAQFVATLTQPLTGVDAVQLDVQGAGPLVLPELQSPVRSVEEVGFARDIAPVPTVAALRRAGELLQVDPARLDEPDQGIEAQAAARDWPTVPAAYVDIALASDGSEISARSVDASQLVRFRGTSALPVTGLGESLTRPGYDGTGRLWVTAVVDSATRVWVVDATTQQSLPAPVQADWLASRVVLDLRAAPDGARVAVVSRAPDGSDERLDVAGVVRDQSGQPIRLATPYRQGEPLVGFTAVTWLDGVTMAVLARQSASDPFRPFVVDLGQGVGLRRRGGAAELSLVTPVPGARTLTTTTSGSRGLVVTTTGPAVFTRVGSAWQVVPSAVELAVAGR